MKIVICGKRGKLGSVLINFLQKNHKIIGLGRDDLDLCDEKALRKKIISINPKIIINAAAYTDVEKSEELKDYALKINSNFTKQISNIAYDIDATLIHFSTDYVFDGKKESSYKETNSTNPINFYGLSKLYGERSILNSSCRFLIFRISTLLSGYKNNIVYKILNNSFKNKELKVVTDQCFTPTSVDFIAKNIGLILSQGIYENLSFNNIYHLSPTGQITPYLLSKRLFKIFNEKSKANFLNPNIIKPILQRDYKSNVIRPQNCILNNEKFYEAIGQKPELWEDQFNLFTNKVISKMIKENLHTIY